MMSIIHFQPKQILIPLIIEEGMKGMSIETADGKRLPFQQTKGLTIYDRRICLEADWLGSDEDRHRVRLPDGQMCWVKETPIEVNIEAAKFIDLTSLSPSRYGCHFLTHQPQFSCCFLIHR